MALKRRSKASVEFSMASMTDLIFLLLIFFMITASFVTPNALNLTMPQASSKVVTDPTATVSIDKDLNYFYKEKKVTIEQLPGLLQGELAQQKEPVIMINADKTVPIDNVVQIMQVGKKLNAKVILGTKPE
ncbi:MAG: ExbD/TolR family protein [Bacteroidia bacterium]